MAKMVTDKKFKCRYGCGASFKSQSGVRYHERKIHGALWKRGTKTHKENAQDEVKPEQNQNMESSENKPFVKIDEVKYMAKKTVNAKDKEDEFECGSCGETFSEKKKFCPNCGVEFE